MDLAAEAYIYGYPLVYDLSMMGTSLRDGFGALAAAPFNRFAHSEHLADHRTEFVSVNNDTLYSIAQLDLTGGPLRLHVPDTGGAYYVLQFVDAWTNNFAYVGRRATGTGEGDWLIVPPGWSGSVPDGVRGVIDAPTAVVTVAGRNACDGPGDLPRVRALQEQLTLTPSTAGPTAPGCPRPSPAYRRNCASSRSCGCGWPTSRRPRPIRPTRTGSSRWGCWRRDPRRTPPRTRLSSAR